MTPQLTPVGCKPDPFDAKDYPFRDSKILGTYRAIVTADSIDWRDKVSDRLIQQCSSCVGHSTRAAGMMVAAIAGHPIPSPSPLFPYTMSRLIGDPPLKPGAPKLQDWGCGTRFAFQGVRDVGFVKYEDWPETPENINAVPDLAAFADANAATVEAFYRIEDGAGAGDQVIAALKRGFTPTVGMTVDQAFSDIASGIYDQPGGAVLGGHCMLIVAYSAVLDAFLLLNWWGNWFGIDGYCWISRRCLESQTFDKWVMQVAPGLS